MSGPRARAKTSPFLHLPVLGRRCAECGTVLGERRPPLCRKRVNSQNIHVKKKRIKKTGRGAGEIASSSIFLFWVGDAKCTILLFVRNGMDILPS